MISFYVKNLICDLSFHKRLLVINPLMTENISKENYFQKNVSKF